MRQERLSTFSLPAGEKWAGCVAAASVTKLRPTATASQVASTPPLPWEQTARKSPPGLVTAPSIT